MPAGWLAHESPSGCFFTSLGSANDVAPGQTMTFDLTIKTAAAKYNHASTFAVYVSSTVSFANPATVKQAGAMGSGLRLRAHVFEILDAVVADAGAVAGAACPAWNHEGLAAATGKVVVICGSNRSKVALSPKGALASLGGTLIASHGSFTSAQIAAGASNVVLGNWHNVTLAGTPATDLTVVARIGSLTGRNTATATLPGYEATGVTNTAPVAGDDSYDVNQTPC